MEDKDLKVSRTTTKYMECKFNNNENENIVSIKIDGKVIPKSD